MRPFLVGFAVLVLPMLVVWKPDGGSEWGFAIANGLLFAVLIVPGIVIHELGHAAVGRALGLSVHEIRIGLGRNIVCWQWRGVEIWVNAIPFGGLVGMGATRPSWVRLRYWLAVLAGPLANLIAAFAIVVATDLDYDSAAPVGAVVPLQMAFLANLYLGVLNLMPLFGDGRALVTLPFRRAAIDELLASRHIWRAERLRRAGDHAAALEELTDGAARVPGSMPIANSVALVLLDQQDYPAARAAFHGLLSRTDLSKPHRAILENNIAWTNLLLDDRALLAEAEALSASAFKAFRGVPSFAGTRGAVMIESGDLREGLALTRRALSLNSEPKARSGNAVWIAIGEARLGHGDAAREHLALARALDPGNPLLARAEAAIGGIVAA